MHFSKIPGQSLLHPGPQLSTSRVRLAVRTVTGRATHNKHWNPVAPTTFTLQTMARLNFKQMRPQNPFRAELTLFGRASGASRYRSLTALPGTSVSLRPVAAALDHYSAFKGCNCTLAPAVGDRCSALVAPISGTGRGCQRVLRFHSQVLPVCGSWPLPLPPRNPL